MRATNLPNNVEAGAKTPRTAKTLLYQGLEVLIAQSQRPFYFVVAFTVIQR